MAGHISSAISPWPRPPRCRNKHAHFTRCCAWAYPALKINREQDEKFPWMHCRSISRYSSQPLWQMRGWGQFPQKSPRQSCSLLPLTHSLKSLQTLVAGQTRGVSLDAASSWPPTFSCPPAQHHKMQTKENWTRTWFLSVIVFVRSWNRLK